MQENMVVIRPLKTFDQNLKHEAEFIIKFNEFLAENKIKNEIEQLLSKYKHGNDIHEHDIHKQKNESHKYALNLSQRLDLRSSNKHVALQNLSIYYTRENIIQQYKNNKLEIIAPTWNDEFELPDGSFSVKYSR